VQAEGGKGASVRGAFVLGDSVRGLLSGGLLSGGLVSGGLCPTPVAQGNKLSVTVFTLGINSIVKVI